MVEQNFNLITEQKYENKTTDQT